MDLIFMASALMPAGKPQFTSVIQYPTISSLVQQEGKKKILVVLVLMVKDFCASLNVVRNMTEDQMLEAAAMLLEECDNFRLEDYLMMFTMAKKGDLHPEVKIYDRIDIQLISQIMDVYWYRRKNAGQQASDDYFQKFDELGNTTRSIENLNPADAKMVSATDRMISAIESLKANMQSPFKSEDEALKDIHKPKLSYTYGQDEKGNEGFKKIDNGNETS